jgi:hypothetical protein
MRSISLLVLLALGAAPVQAQSVLIPAYENPCCNAGVAMWSSLIDNARLGKVKLAVILEPASGPGASPIDPNYVNAAGVGPAVELTAAGGKLYGYVPTGYGTRPLSSVFADIDTYYDPAYWRGAGVLVSGIFVDEMSNDLALTSYYRSVTSHIRAKNAGAHVFGNPGTTFTIDSSGGASGFSLDDYAGSVDTIVTFENAGPTYRTAYAAPSWVDHFDASHFAHIIHSEPAIADMLTDLELARTRKAGFVYVTDDVLPNPYNVLPSYWTQQLDALAAPAVPVLATRSGVALAALLLAAALRGFRRRRAPSA